MYDPQTAALIRAAPPLDGLNRDSLPEQITEDFATIVSLRIRVLTAEGGLPRDLREELDRLHRLAQTYEAYVLLLPERGDKQAAAYVAGAARHLLHLAGQLRPSGRQGSSWLSREAVSPDASAALLFLIAGYPSDAAEAAKRIVGDRPPTVEGILLRALGHLARGELQCILDIAVPDDPRVDGAAPETVATKILWHRILHDVRTLSRRLLGAAKASDERAQDPLLGFRQTMELAAEDVDLGDDLPSDLRAKRFACSLFAGPHHLAALLLQAGRALLDSAVVDLPTPPGVDDSRWRAYLSRLALRRPFLWSNHRDAVKRGYLAPGTSAAIGFPTGAGKSALAELKIASALDPGGKVVVLVPTHALVSETTSNLRRAFPDATVRHSVLLEGHYAEVEQSVLPDVAVMTPERCLALLGVAAEAFSSVGLLVLDECHILHPRAEGNDRRSLDAMLCLLGLLNAAPKTDVMLMSAMMSNAEDLAGWLGSLLNRKCLAMSLDWKPTRQVRGCVVFTSERTKELTSLLRKEHVGAIQRAKEHKGGKRKKATGGPRPGQGVLRQLTAVPYALFCLHQTWRLRSRGAYSLQLLQDEPVSLYANPTWRLTPNKNKVAASIASRFARLGMKTLVFTQNRIHCKSLASAAAKACGPARTQLDLMEDEQAVLQVSVDEVGREDGVYGTLGDRAVCHHGLMLPSERKLIESLFARDSGIDLLAATSTLAQGINLPAEVVIIAGDDRFDREAGKMRRLEAHELLNAAGRAGRAGKVAQGLVLVIPGVVVDFDDRARRIDRRWFDLQERVFSKTDQCVDIEDPIGLMLDLIQDSADEAAGNLTYFVRRLPPPGEGECDTRAEQFLSRSLAAYHAAKRSDSASYDAKVQAALRYRRRVLPAAEEESCRWLREVAAKTGVPVIVLSRVDEALQEIAAQLPVTTKDWVDWAFTWFGRNQRQTLSLLNPNILFELFKAECGLPAVEMLEAKMHQIARRLHGLAWRWMTGSTLDEIEKDMASSRRGAARCDTARKLVLRCLQREVSYAMGVVTQLWTLRLQHSRGQLRMPTALACLAPCMREGHDSPEKLAIRYRVGGIVSRASCRNVHEVIADNLSAGDPYEPFSRTRERVDQAMRLSGM